MLETRQHDWKGLESTSTQGMECRPTFTQRQHCLEWDSQLITLSTTSWSWPERNICRYNLFYQLLINLAWNCVIMSTQMLFAVRDGGGRLLAGWIGSHVLFCEGECQVSEWGQEAGCGADQGHGERDEGGWGRDQEKSRSCQGQGRQRETTVRHCHPRQNASREKDSPPVWLVRPYPLQTATTTPCMGLKAAPRDIFILK